MILVPESHHAALFANAIARRSALAGGKREPDPVPVLRLFDPVGSATWLATEIDENGILFGLADLGFGCPELGSFALAELESARLPFGMGIERDLHFTGRFGLPVYAEAARRAGSLVLAERLLGRAASTLSGGR